MTHQETDTAFQQRMLQHVSRTFALTIPLLPPDIAAAVGNAYLVCRIADTIEDDPSMALGKKQELFSRLVQSVEGELDPELFAAQAAPLLSTNIPKAEKELMEKSARVLRVTHELQPVRRGAISKCVALMAEGMETFQNTQSLRGLRDQPEMDRYCYYVAGVVGEMLTEIFCDHDPRIAAHGEQLIPLGRSFGQGLQMTNILKDVWDDRRRGACWLPRSAFRGMEDCTDLVAQARQEEVFVEGMAGLTDLCAAHLDNAFKYITMIPPDQGGIRKFCLLALGLALLTLRKLSGPAHFIPGVKSKIGRTSVMMTLSGVKLLAGNDFALRQAHRVLIAPFAKRLPKVEVEIFTP